MNWLIGQHARSFEMVKKYWSFGSQATAEIFLPFVHSDNLFLDVIKCRELHKLTFFNDELPFGKVDKQSTVGMVATDPEYCDRFNSEICRALKIIDRVPELASLLRVTVRSFVPLTGANLRKDGSGKSCHWLKGAIFLSLPQDRRYSELELALNIVHELGHQVLMIYQDADSIMTDLYKPVFSSIRKTERPAIMSFHALVAIYFMLFFFHSLLNSSNKWSPEELAYLKAKILKLSSDFTGAMALKDIDFSPLGLLMMQEMMDYCLSIRTAA